MNKTMAQRTLEQKLKQARQALKEIEIGLVQLEAGQDKDPGNWGFSGDAGYAANELNNIASFLLGKEL